MTSSEPPAEASSFGAERDPRPVVRPPAAGLPGAAIAGIALLLAAILFVFLDGRRQQGTIRPSGRDAVSAFPGPPALMVPAEPVPAPAMAPVITTRPLPFTDLRPPVMRRSEAAPILQPPMIVASPPSQPAAQQSTSRSSEPALILDNGVGDKDSLASNGSGTNQNGQNAAAAAGEDAPVRTTVIRNRTTIMPTGTVIPAVLETPIDSARPGLVRAIVSEDARGFDGKEVLIPKGSRLIGEYQSEVRSGQSRVLVTWTRLIRPDGVAIRIGSPAADAMGGAGIPGRVNNFFFQRFAGAVLQSALTIGVNLASRPGNGSVVVGLPTNAVGTIGQDLIPGNDLKPKIKVRQGAVFDVFVARDLDFSGSLYRSQDKAR